MEPERSSPGPARPGSSSSFNSELRCVIEYLIPNAPHGAFFRRPVSCAMVTDYRDYVSADDEMYLGKMLERTSLQQYLSVAAFRADLQLIFQNAKAYNGRNGGMHAYEPVIHWASDLVNAAEEQLQMRMPALLAAEADLIQTSPKSDVTASADGALPTPDEANAAPTSRASPPSPLLLTATAPAPEVVPDANPAKPPSNEVEGVIASTGQQSSSPSSGSGHTHSALDALLAACELAAEQDSAAPKDEHETAATMGSSGGASDGAGAGDSILANALAPERRSYPGCTTPSKDLNEQRREVGMAIVPYAQGVGEAGARQQPQPAATLPEEPAGSSEGCGVVVCGRTVGGGEVGVSPAPRVAAGGAACNGSGGGGGETLACSSYLNSNAFKFRRHKSKVFIKPNKVVYLPTTFVEEECDVSALPLECELRVEADGVLTEERFRVLIKAVPRQGLSTMYCMTNVMRFQQLYLNWQIFNWTWLDSNHLMIHLQSPSPGQCPVPRPEMDRATGMSEGGRHFTRSRGSDDGGAGPRNGIKRKSDSGRYNMHRVDRRVMPEHGRDMNAELRPSSNSYVQRQSPISESPPASPQRRISSGVGPLPQRGPVTGQVLPSRAALHHHPAAPGAPLQLYGSMAALQQQNLFSLPPRPPGLTVKHELPTNGSDPGIMSPVMDAMALAGLQHHMQHLPVGHTPRGGGLNGNGGAAAGPRSAPQLLPQATAAMFLEHQLARGQHALQVHGASGEPPNLAALQMALASALQHTHQHNQHGQGPMQSQHGDEGLGVSAPALDLNTYGFDTGALTCEQHRVSAAAAAASQQQQVTLQHRAVRGLSSLIDHQLAGRRDENGDVDGEYDTYDMGGLHTAYGTVRRASGGMGPPEVYGLGPAEREQLQWQERARQQQNAASRQPRPAPVQDPRHRQHSRRDSELVGHDDRELHNDLQGSLAALPHINGAAGRGRHAPFLAGPRYSFELGPGPASGPGNGGRVVNRRGGNGGSGPAQDADAGALDLSNGGSTTGSGAALELMSLLSPNKRFKIAVGPSQMQTAPNPVGGVDGGGGGGFSALELGLLEAMGARAAGQLTPAAEATLLAALRSGALAQAGGGLPGRQLMQVNSELLSQFM